MTVRLERESSGADGLRTASLSAIRTDGTSMNTRREPSIYVWDEDPKEAEQWARELADVIAHG